MAYQNVGTPRFYVSILQWLKSLGKLSFNYSNWSYNKDPLSLIDINPSNIINFAGYGLSGENTVFLRYDVDGGNFNTLMPNDKNFFMVLGHNFNKDNVQQYLTIEWESGYHWLAQGDYVNYTYAYHQSEYDGFSIGVADNAHSNDNNKIALQFLEYDPDAVFKLGPFLYGTYYDMNAPNLSLTMSREYGGTNEFTTYNGSSMSNTFWNKPPSWGDLGAWELGDGNPALAKSGRRTWDLKFSYMDDSDLWGSNQMLSQKIGGALSDSEIDLYVSSGNEDDLMYGDIFNYNLLTDDNFFSQVWHKTLGMTLPCIFQPDSSNSNPDQFAIVKGVPNSLKATRSSFNTYDISLSIEEVW